MKVTVIKDAELAGYLEGKLTTRPDYGPELEGLLASYQEEVKSRYEAAKRLMDETRKKYNKQTKGSYKL